MNEKIAAKERLVIAVVGLGPLPGTYKQSGHTFESIRARAIKEAKTLRDAGVDGLMIQNVNDLPMVDKVYHDTVAFMTAVGVDIRRAVGDDFILGVSVLKNDGAAGIAVAEAARADFVRLKVYVGAMVSAGGIEEGCVNEVLKMKRRINASVDLWADIHDRTGVPLGDAELEDMIHEALDKGELDAVILTGKTFAETEKFLSRSKTRFPGLYRFVGGGVKSDNLAEAFANGNGVFVSSCLREGGHMTGALIPEKVREFMSKVRAL